MEIPSAKEVRDHQHSNIQNKIEKQLHNIIDAIESCCKYNRNTSVTLPGTLYPENIKTFENLGYIVKQGISDMFTISW